MRINSVLILLILCLSLVANPFTSKKKPASSPQPKVEKKTLFKPNRQILTKQKQIYSLMMKEIRELKTNRNSSSLIIILGFAFLYGLLHALGPGHGKIFSASYFLQGKKRLTSAISLGMGAGMMHAISGLVIVYFFHFILKVSGQSVANNFSSKAQILSYILIILIGFFLLIKAFRGSHSHSEKTSFWGILLSIGLVPCPGVVLVATFSVFHDLAGLGAFLILTMAIGMGVAISLSNMLILLGKKSIFKFVKDSDKTSVRISQVFSVSGALLLIFVGSFLLRYSL